ncbi:hypothetical protein ACQPZX_05345 [Actinoplanes sp. CA-142083]|uniref:hypothetical protein n=1 Tax=Actinoplanes sp. CA-142083 TaxID=3239903 RepID=UPI003D93C1A5
MADDEVQARRAADHLALALEEVGFDVGQDFPSLQDTLGRRGLPVVRVGDISPEIADRLAVALVSGATGDVTRTWEGNDS